ncbi:MAG: tetratricopeptide repeat protein [Planctomycetota bacterium]|jgi:tetratricopeptide (TPR) repeat protein
MNATSIAAILASLVLLTACQSNPQIGADGSRLYEGYGGYHRKITTTDPDAQRWFDQGIQLVYGFNHDEGVRSFQRATEIDPDCAMAWWGIAYGYGVDVNNMQVSDAEAKAGAEAAERALVLKSTASPVEQALIEAVSKRAVWPMPENRRELDEAYAQAMGEAWEQFPDDADVGTLYAEALMNLQPWDYWTVSGEPKARAEELVAVLEASMRIDPSHPGANHFYIHAVEASSDPNRATPAADRLTRLVPGSGHLVHMPSHIYITTGRYADALVSNQEAIAADEAYFAVAPPPDFYSLYFIHNIHFLAYAAMMEGNYQIAIDATRKMEREVPQDFIENWTAFADGLMPASFHVMVRFGRWQEILAEPDYPEYRLASRVIRLYARAVALANLGRTGEARGTMVDCETLAAQVPEDWTVGTNQARVIHRLALGMADAEILWHEGKAEAAYAKLRETVEAQDALVYDEPPGWMQPVRHALGALLLAGDQGEEAEAVYREDLRKHPKNAWSLLGLQQALRMNGKDAEAEAMDPQVRYAWARADVRPPASCYCAVTAR